MERIHIVEPDMGALRRIVCETFRISDSDCGSAIPVTNLEYASYARVYSFSLPGSRSVIARLVAPVKPLFKTEGEVAAMDFVRSKWYNSTFVPMVFSKVGFFSNRSYVSPCSKSVCVLLGSEPSRSRVDPNGICTRSRTW